VAKILYAFLLCPTHLILLDLIIVIIFGLSRLPYSSQHPVLKPLNLCSSLRVRYQVPHPYNTTDKIIVFYISIFKLLDSDRKTKDSEQHGSKDYLNLGSFLVKKNLRNMHIILV
jgi:hypothetical protein